MKAGHTTRGTLYIVLSSGESILKRSKTKYSKPLEQKITGYFLPILQPAISNIELQEQRSPRIDTAATDYWFERREQLGVVRPDLPSVEMLSPALYDCSKRVHYAEVIDQYEALETEVNDYQSRCLAYVQSLATRIKEHMGLPNQMPVESGPWVRAEALALHIYRRQQALEPHGVRLRESLTHPTNTVELPGGSGAVIQMTQAEANKALELVTELENNRGRLDELRSKAAFLQQQAMKLRDLLDRLLYTSSLKGRCDLLQE